MKCKDCTCCHLGWFPSKPDEYVCIGVKVPVVIENVNCECSQYTERFNECKRDLEDESN